jgi:hypothetical protein
MGLAKPLIIRLDKTALDPEKDQIRMVTVKYELPHFLWMTFGTIISGLSSLVSSSAMQP